MDILFWRSVVTAAGCTIGIMSGLIAVALILVMWQSEKRD